MKKIFILFTLFLVVTLSVVEGQTYTADTSVLQKVTIISDTVIYNIPELKAQIIRLDKGIDFDLGHINGMERKKQEILAIIAKWETELMKNK